MPPKLRIGRVKWFGGTKKETGKVLPYGFIGDGSLNDLFAHSSKLDCNANDLQEGVHVIFEEHHTEKGREAHSVRILESENDHSVLEALMQADEIPLEFRLRVLVGYTDPVSAGITKFLATIVKEVENNELNIRIGMDIPISESDTSRLELEWPQSWFDYELDGDVFHAMPRDFKILACKKHYSNFLEALNSLSRFKVTKIEARKIYAQFNTADFKLAEIWCGARNNDFDLAKMISARGAEIASLYFYESVGNNVTDTAVQQIHGGQDWLTHDLLLNDQIPIDVKNARQNVNASVLVEYTVPKFKFDRNSAEVRICGTLSPYANIDWIKKGKAEGNIIFLGETTRSEIDALISQYNKADHLQLEGSFQEKLPVWLFNIPKSISGSEPESGATNDSSMAFTSSITPPESQHWQFLPSSLLPGCLAMGIDLPKHIEDNLPKWERLFIASLNNGGALTLGKIYLAVLSHFCLALKYMNRAEHNGFAPSRYWELLYINKPTLITGVSRPLGIVDPLGVVSSLIEALTILWEKRKRLELNGVRTLRVTPEGLVTGRFEDGRTKTILAYCGGKVDGKGKCGFSPLILGEHSSCKTCGKLECPKCSYCSPQCDEK